MSNPEKIVLIDEGSEIVWCDSIPSADIHPDDVTEYYRADYVEQLQEQLKEAKEKIDPFTDEIISSWSICGMNHYHVEGERYLFVSLVKDGRCVTHEGLVSDTLFWAKLRMKAANDVEDNDVF